MYVVPELDPVRPPLRTREGLVTVMNQVRLEYLVMYPLDS